MKKILFRADAAPHIGIGDLISLIHISKYFSDDWEKYFVVRNYDAALGLVEKHALENCYMIDGNISVEDEVEYLNRFFAEHEIDVVFFEITEHRLSEYEGLTPSVKKCVLVFDGHILENMNLVIDWDVEAEKFFNVERYPGTTFLLGPQYVILPPEFYGEVIRERAFSKVPKKVLIAMGGADEYDFTRKVVEAIARRDIEVELDVIVGSGYANREALEAYMRGKGLKYTIKQNVTEMLDAYLGCDVAVGAGGLTSSELVASRTPALLIATYEHQIARCRYFDQQQWVKYLGYRTFSGDELEKYLLQPVIPGEEVLFNTGAIIDAIEML